jgi:DNA-binding transcriptional ArsR family regulator
MASNVLPFKRPPFSKSVDDFIQFHAREVGPIASMIYMVIRKHEKWGTHQCWPSIARIAHLVGVSVSSVQRHLHILVKAGLITVEKRWNKDGGPTTHLFTVLDPSPAAVAKRLQAMEEAARGGGSIQRPPSLQTATTPGSTQLPEQSFSLEQELLNEQKPACAEEMGTENLVQTSTVDTPPAHPDRQPCTHPHEECSHYDDITVCKHCWTLVDTIAVEEGQAHSAIEAA